MPSDDDHELLAVFNYAYRAGMRIAKTEFPRVADLAHRLDPRVSDYAEQQYVLSQVDGQDPADWVGIDWERGCELSGVGPAVCSEIIPSKKVDFNLGWEQTAQQQIMEYNNLNHPDLAAQHLYAWDEFRCEALPHYIREIDGARFPEYKRSVERLAARNCPKV